MIGDAASRVLVGWVTFGLRRPATLAALVGVATLALAAGLPRLETAAGYRAFLGADHPVVTRLDAFTARFGGGLPFAAVWSCTETEACDGVFEPAALQMAHEVARHLEAVPGVVAVDGPATSPVLMRPEIGFPEARRLFVEGAPAPDLDRLAAAARSDPSWVGQIVSADGRAGALVIQLESSDTALGARALAALDEALAPHERAGFRFHRIGGPVEFVVAGGELEAATARMIPVMVALVAGVLALLFRRVGPALVTLACVGLAVVWTLGLQGWLGWPQTSLTQVLPPLVLVIGVCDAIHLLAAYASAPGATGSRGDRERAVTAAVAQVGWPCLVTTATTMAGFASFAVSGLESFARFGGVAAFGVGAALVLTLSVLPPLLVRLPAARMVSIPGAASFDRGLHALTRFARDRRALVLGVSAVAAALGAVGMLRLEVDARFEDLYGEESRVVQWVAGASRHLRQAETLEIAVLLPDGERTDRREPLAVLASLAPLEGLPDLGPGLSALVPARHLHELLHGVPLGLGPDDDAERPGQMMRLLRREAPGFHRQFVDPHAALRLSLQAGKTPQRELRALLGSVHAELDRALPEGYAAVVTGPLATVAAMIDEIRVTQLSSFALAGVLVWLLVMLAFRSVTLGAMALVPTLLPVIVTLGSMGFVGIALDVGSAMVAAVVIGLAVDDAIHLLQAYGRRREQGEAADAAIAGAVHDVGRALVTTSLALVVGFTALAMAPWQSIASFGAVSAIAILTALGAALVTLPALVPGEASHDPRSGSSSSSRPEVRSSRRP